MRNKLKIRIICFLLITFFCSGTYLLNAATLISFDDLGSHLPESSDYVFENNILTMKTGSNLFSNTSIATNAYTVNVKAAPGDYKAGDIVEICINIGVATNHNRFMIKDIGTERNNIPRNAYTKHVKMVNGAAQSGTADTALGSQFVSGQWFDIKIEVDGKKAEMYVDGVLCQTIFNDTDIGGLIGFRGKGVSFKEFSVVSNNTDGASILGTYPLSTEEEFLKFFNPNTGDTYSNGTVTLDSLNMFSTDAVEINQYTVSVKATVGEYKANDIVEICVNIGTAANHYRFMIKDIGSERNNVPRNAYTKYVQIKNNAVDDTAATAEKGLNSVFENGNWFEIVIVVDGKNADMYVNGELCQTINSDADILGFIGFRGKGASFKELYISEGLHAPEIEDINIVGADPFASEEEFLKFFTLKSNEVFSDKTLTLGNSNVFSNQEITLNQFTVRVKATVGDYKAGDIVEICINIGSVTNHHRFMIKDVGSERNNVPRNAFTKYTQIVNGQTNNDVTTSDSELNKLFEKNQWFDIVIVINGTEAFMYVDGKLCQTVTDEKGFAGQIGFRGNGASFKELYVSDTAENPETDDGSCFTMFSAVTLLVLSSAIMRMRKKNEYSKI